MAQKKANSFGLYDMTGNVGELCWDAEVNPDPAADTDHWLWYLGGDWEKPLFYEFGNRDDLSKLEITSRPIVPVSPDFKENTIGFRVVRNIK